MMIMATTTSDHDDDDWLHLNPVAEIVEKDSSEEEESKKGRPLSPPQRVVSRCATDRTQRGVQSPMARRSSPPRRSTTTTAPTGGVGFIRTPHLRRVGSTPLARNSANVIDCCSLA